MNRSPFFSRSFAGAGLGYLGLLAVVPSCHSFKWTPLDDGVNVDTGPSPMSDSLVDTGLFLGGDEPDPPLDTGTPAMPDTVPDEVLRCDALYALPSGSVFYVDPTLGFDGNDGSSALPWANLQNVVDEKVDCVDQDGQSLHDSAPVQGGDTIVLMGAAGYEAGVSIKGCFNSDYVTIIGEQLRVPSLGEIEVKGGAYWHFEGLGVEGSGGPLVRIERHSSRGDAHHIRVHDNLLTSGDLQTQDDYLSRASDAVRLSNVTDVAISCNDMIKVGAGVVVGGDRVDVLFNTIRFFSADGLVNSGDTNRYIGNVVTDGVKLGDGHHDDFFQSHRGVYPDPAVDVEISYNIFMNRYTDEQPAGSHGPVQCIGAFEEGHKTGWKVFNNVCKGDHYHGITMNDMHDSLIINNTVVGGGDFPGVAWETPDRTWINVSGTGNILRNNLTSNMLSEGDHNIEVTPEMVDQVFNNWGAGDFSLHLASIAIDGGEVDGAPGDDVLGVVRTGTPDVGAYEGVED
jgi:hypothetical protein